MILQPVPGGRQHRTPAALPKFLSRVLVFSWSIKQHHSRSPMFSRGR